MGRLTACRSCGSTDLHDFLDLGRSPLADAFPATPDEPQPRYPLGLAVCERCWLVQNTETVPDDLLWTDGYGFFTGASPSSIAYFEDYARQVSPLATGLTVEVASNDGTLLRNISGRVLGVEPSANVAQVAIDAGIPTIVKPFGREVAADIGEKADLIIANNVVAHVADLDDFLGGMADLLADDGAAVIEFQYVADLLTGNQFDHVYHEHRSFFSLSSLGAALAQHGLHIESWQHTPAQGGSVRAWVRHGGSRGPLGLEGWLRRPDAYTGFQGRVDHIRDRLRTLVRQHRPVGYAAAAKATTLLNYCGFDAYDIPAVVDLTPHKIGRYMPGTGIPIVADADADAYLVMAWNYLPGILRRERAFLDGGGKLIVPIPTPIVL